MEHRTATSCRGRGTKRKQQEAETGGCVQRIDILNKDRFFSRAANLSSGVDDVHAATGFPGPKTVPN